MLSLVAEDGVVLAAREWHVDGRAPRATVVLVHGFSAGKDDPQVVAVAERLQGRGYAVLTYDSRGHGASGGTCTLGDLERRDVAAAVAHVREQDGAAPVVLLGASMGAIAVLGYAAVDGAVAGVVTVSSPALWRLPRTARALLATGLTRTRLGRRLAAWRLGVRIDRRWSNPPPPSELITRIRVPTMIIHGADDRFIPAQAARDLHAAGSGSCQLVIVPRMGHAFDPLALDSLAEAVEWVLSQPQPQARPETLDPPPHRHADFGARAPTTTPGPPAPDRYGRPSPD